MVDKAASHLAGRRLALLIRQVGDEQLARDGSAGEPNWSQVGRDIGCSQTYVSKLLRGERVSVGIDVIGSVRRRVGIGWRFFEDPSLQEPHYRNFLGDDGGGRPIHPDDERTLKHLLGGMTSPVTGEEIDALERLAAASPAPGSLTREWFAAVLEANRSLVPGRTPSQNAELSGTRKRAARTKAAAD